jgi:mRNA interferase RelE/StbE
MYQVHFVKDAIRDLKELDKATAKRIIRKINWLAENADTIQPEGLRGKLAGLAKIREGDYRIVYEIIRAEEILIVHFIGHRSEVYKNK